MNQTQEKYQKLKNCFKKVIFIDNLPDPNSQYTQELLYYYELMVGNNSYNDNSFTQLADDWYSSLKNTNSFNNGTKTVAFFFPKCNVPRYKVREWGKNNNLSITTKVEKATAKFISKKSFTSEFEETTFAVIKRKDLIKWMSINYPDIDKTDNPLNNLWNFICNSQIETVYLPSQFHYYRSYFNGNSYGRQPQPNSCTALGLEVKTSHWQPYCKEVEFSDIIEKYSDPEIYSEEDILQYLNEDSLIIDEQIYNQLRQMFKSVDKKNHLLALETICNSNITPSLHYILLLIKEFSGSSIYYLKERNHINYKSLLTYIGITQQSHLNEDTIITILMDKDVLTMEILKKTADQIKEQWKNCYNTQHFKINTITVSDEVKQYFKKQSIESKIEQTV